MLDEETGELLECRHLIKKQTLREQWGYSFGNEIGRLAQGMPGRNTGTNTVYFIDKSEISEDRWKQVNRTRLMVNGSRIDAEVDCGTPTASLFTVKMLLDSVISTKGEKFMTLDIKDFYLNTPLGKPEYARMKISNSLQDVIDHYELKDNVGQKGSLYVNIMKGMHGLPHAGITAQKFIEEGLNKAEYHQSDKTPGFWKHE